MPPEHIVFGSDIPAASPLDTAKGLGAFFGDDALAKIERGNARWILAAMG
jgi:predicted TIM-barrel fold metal-dependent hydrolase